MSNLKRLNKLYISLLVTIIAIILGSSIVNAVDFSGFSDGNNPLEASKEFYCIEHQAWFSKGTWEPTSTWTITSDNVSHPNRILANILYNGIKTGQGGYNFKGEYQWAIWKWFYENGRVSTIPVSSPRYDLAYRETINPLPYSSENAGLSVADNQVTMEGNVGSLKINNLTGKVDKIEIIWKDPTDNKEYTKNITSGNYREAGWIEFYSDKECTKPLNINNFNKGTIYVRNLKEDYDIKNINIHVTNNASGYSVTITRWRKNTKQTSEQDLLSATMQEGKTTEVTIPLKIKYTYGDIRIIKKGVYIEDGKAKEQNVTADFKIFCTNLNKWVAGDANGNKTYVDSIDKATTYKSDVTVKRLLSSYKYQLVEVAVNNPYYNNPIKMVAVTSNLQQGLKVIKKDAYYSSSSVIVYSNRTNIVTVKDERTSGNIKIIKADDTRRDVLLQGAKFKIYSKDTGWLVRNSDGTYKYDADIGSATEFESNANGEVDIKGVKNGVYFVYETQAPEGYDITKQDGYENRNNKDPYTFSKDNKLVYLGEVNLNTSNNTAKYNFTNKKIVNLEGNVWVDKPDTKANEYDNVYKENTNDFLLKDIKVYLKNSNNETIAETLTDANGHYKFENLNYWDLENCYVEFAYDNKEYVVVDPFVGDDTRINSKAMEEIMQQEELKDELLTGVDGDLPGRAITYKGGNNLTQTPLTGYYNNTTYTVENINLGIKEKNNPEYSVSETLEYVKVKMKGYTYTYKYGEDPVTLSTYVPKVAEQNSKATFTAAIYPTDVAYNIANNTPELQVFVVYRIDVTNTETEKDDDRYVEQRLYLNSMENKYDINRYDLSNESNGNNEIENKQFALWSNNNGQATYDLSSQDNVYKDGIKPNETKSSYIQFKVKEDALERMITKTMTDKDTESAPTVATANAYHEYIRTDNVWDKENSKKAYDGAKNEYDEKYFVHKSVSKDANSADLYIKLTLSDSRKLAGTVFEDTIIKDSEGKDKYGTLDEGEKNRAQKVKVELLNEDKSISKLYQVKDKAVVYEENGELPNAIVYTSKEGKYEFDGVVPGYYYIRFTYGDGTQKMIDTNGNEVDIKSNDYRSTRINNNYIHDSMEASKDAINNAQQALVKDYKNEEAKKLVEWYKYLGEESYSTAVDDLTTRKLIDGYVYNSDGTIENKEINADIMNIPAYTPIFGISIENETDNIGSQEHKNVFTGFNFGVIKQPDTIVTVEKKITDVKFTNQSGTTIVSENPVSRQSNYVTSLETIEGGSKNAKLEIEPENIYGSSIELTYEIKITNNAEYDDYTEESYYKYGESGSTKKTVQVHAVEDDLDSKFNYNSLPEETTQTKTSESGSTGNIKLEPITEKITNPDGSTTTKQYVKMTGWEKLAKGESTSTSYTVTALVANDETDPIYNNDAKVKSLSVDTLSTVTTESLKKWEGSKTQFVITPTTGENRNYTYWYVGAIALAIVAAGVILIKKKVL